MSKPRTDKIFATERTASDFVFDEQVADVFTDMVNRSVPGYATILSMIGVLADRYCSPGSRVYDLGCSLGGAALSMLHHISRDDFRLIAVDNSPPMVDRFRTILAQQPRADLVELLCADINDVQIREASVVVLNFTLQFIAPGLRSALIQRIADGMQPGGILILSEKVRFADDTVNDLLIDMYHQFKHVRGYSQLEISQKRTALENVLIPETIDDHKSRIRAAGFRSCDTWFQCFNFTSLIAIR